MITSIVIQNSYASAINEDLLHSSAVSLFGKPVFSDVKLKAGSQEIILINAVQTVELKNTIISTPVQGISGTVKEYISAQDYLVTMSGSIIGNDPNTYPRTDFQKFIRIIETADWIEVVSEYLKLFGIHYLVMDHYRCTQTPGFQHLQNFEIVFLSDKDVQLVINEQQ